MILLDTHSLLWYLSGDPKLPDARRKEINTESILCCVSIASFWEIATKQSLKKLEYEKEIDEILQLVYNSPIPILQIQGDHIKQVAKLPFHHRDPFDRILIAQAQTESLTIVTKDKWFASYQVKTAWN